MRPDKYESIDKGALVAALLALHTCPHCRADLQPVANLADVWGCEACRETWHLPATVLRCDGRQGCEAPVTHVDRKGYGYCTPHGIACRGDRPCRQLRDWEVRRLQAGLTIKY